MIDLIVGRDLERGIWRVREEEGAKLKGEWDEEREKEWESERKRRKYLLDHAEEKSNEVNASRRLHK